MTGSALTRVGITVLALSFAVAACGDDDRGNESGDGPNATPPPKAIVEQIPGRPVFSKPQAPGTYVGAAGEKLDPAVAFVVQDDQVVVYLCDGRESSDWFAGPVEGDRFELESENGTRISGAVTPARVTGTLTLVGRAELKFVALPAAGKRPRTGLFVFDDPTEEGYKARWIVTREVVRGVSSNATGSGTNGLTITPKPSGSGGTSGSDTRFTGINPSQSQIVNEVNALRAELAAARNESTSLRDALGGGKK